MPPSRSSRLPTNIHVDRVTRSIARQKTQTAPQVETRQREHKLLPYNSALFLARIRPPAGFAWVKGPLVEDCSFFCDTVLTRLTTEAYIPRRRGRRRPRRIRVCLGFQAAGFEASSLRRIPQLRGRKALKPGAQTTVYPVVLFDKCIGRKRNAGGGVLARFAILGWGAYTRLRRYCVYQVTRSLSRKANANVCLGLVNRHVDVVISRDKFSVQPESLILAQNERWRQA
jgi:hypothetical protein